MDELIYDPYDYELHRNPYPVWKRMRDEAPLYWSEKHEFFALSRFADVEAASIDVTTYSSANGSVLELLDLPVEQIPQTLIFMDPPRHTQLRKLVNRAFTNRRVDDLELRIRELCVGYLDAVVGEDTFDLIEDFAAKLPMMVIGSLVGIPESDQDQVRRWTDQLVERTDGETDFGFDVWATMDAYMLELAAERRVDPRDDLMTVLVESELEEDDGTRRRLTDEELAAFLTILSGAGNETTTRLIGWAGWLLAKHPDERKKLVADPSLIGNSVEEVLRYEPVSTVQARKVTRDVELYGETVSAGSKMALVTGSAGRDERVFPDPDRFDVSRHFERHLSFGYGIHHCLGAALARLEGRVALEEMLRRFPDWDIDETSAEMIHTSTVRGFSRLPVDVT